MNPDENDTAPVGFDPDRAFLLELWTRRTPFTYLFLALNFLIFLLMELSGGTTNEATLLAFGVKSNAAIDGGEFWRFLTPVFIHIGLLHLAFNSYRALDRRTAGRTPLRQCPVCPSLCLDGSSGSCRQLPFTIPMRCRLARPVRSSACSESS